MTAAELAARLNARWTGDDWIARCPAHDDRKPSLSIAEGKDGRVLLHCHAGCTHEAVLAELRLTPSALFPAPVNETRKRIVATYDYVDREGRTIYQVVRYDPKDFRQRRPDTSNPGNWIWDMKGIDRVLYRLPSIEAAKAEGRAIYVVEGEKDADTLAKIGVCATCNAGGAGKWQSSYSDALIGANVIILPDKDAPGRKHAALVQKELIGKAKSVLVVELPDRNGSRVKDAADWVAAGGTAEELREIVQDAPTWTPPDDAPEETPRHDNLDPLSPLRALQSGASVDEVIRALNQFKALMLSCDPVSAEVYRGEAVKILEDRQIKNALRIVAAAIQNQKRDESKDANEPIVRDPEPWPDQVDGAALLDELVQTVRRFVVMNEPSAVASALWILHAPALDAAFTSPLLCITSPEKRCGKTTCLRVVGALAPRALFASNITPAAIFRAVDKYAPTLLMDEADTYGQGNEEFRGILNSGHTRDMAYVYRASGENCELQRFSTWCPKAIALIGKLPDTLEDRSICIRLERKRVENKTERLSAKVLESLEALCRKSWRWAQDNLAALKVADPEIPKGLNDRAADNWRLLFAIADIAGGDWPVRARDAAVALSGDNAEDGGSLGERVLYSIRDIFADAGRDRMPSAEICAKLAEMEGSPWPEFQNGKPITPPQLARLLKPFGIKPRTIRIGEVRAKGYYLDDFSDVFARYLPPAKRDTVTMPVNKGDSAFLKRDNPENVTFQKVEETPVNKGLSRCHVSTPPKEEEEEEITI